MFRRMAPPTFEQLRQHLGRYGPDGIMESSQGLTDEEREQLATLVKDARKTHSNPSRPKRRKK